MSTDFLKGQSLFNTVPRYRQLCKTRLFTRKTEGEQEMIEMIEMIDMINVIITIKAISMIISVVLAIGVCLYLLVYALLAMWCIWRHKK